MIDPGLQHLVAVVTGGNSGIGAAISRALAANGARVVIHYHPGSLSVGELHTIPGEGEAQRLVEEIEHSGGKAMAIRGDLSRADVAEEVFNRVEKTWGVSRSAHQ